MGDRDGVGTGLVVLVCILPLRVRGVAPHCLSDGTFSDGCQTIGPAVASPMAALSVRTYFPEYILYVYA
jgi:hypothetical protein